MAMMAPLAVPRKLSVCRGKGLGSIIRALWGPGWPRLLVASRREKYCHNGGMAYVDGARVRRDVTIAPFRPLIVPPPRQ
jgi:hypothetical protein